MLKFIQLTLFILLVSSCTTIQTTSDYETKTDFSSFKKYAWLNESDNPSENIRINNKMVIDIVRTEVEKHLNSKGFTKTAPEQADFLIAWFGAIEQKIKTQNINHFYSTYGYGTLYHNPSSNAKSQVATVKEYEEGSLIFDFLNPKDHTLLWRGSGRDKLIVGQAEEIAKHNLKKAVNHILSGFPPQ